MLWMEGKKGETPPATTATTKRPEDEYARLRRIFRPYPKPFSPEDAELTPADAYNRRQWRWYWWGSAVASILGVILGLILAFLFRTH